jgi:hypothetical protein
MSGQTPIADYSKGSVAACLRNPQLSAEYAKRQERYNILRVARQLAAENDRVWESLPEDVKVIYRKQAAHRFAESRRA